MFNRGEAISFVDHVKSQFEDDPKKYERFLSIMRDLKGNLIGPSKVLPRIAELFNGYPDLAMEFNAFLPTGYHLHSEGEGRESHILLITPNDGGWPRGDVVTVRRRRSGYSLLP